MKIRFKIESHVAGLRLDKALSFCPEIRTRSRAEKLLGVGAVLHKSIQPKPSYITKTGDEFDIDIPVTETGLKPYEFPLDIIFEDTHLLVLNKPAGLVVHPAAGNPEKTLVNALLWHTENLSMGFNEKRPGIVHRLDKDTSGLLVVAKNDKTHENLAIQFRNKSVHRIYWAIVYGHPKSKSGVIQSNLGRHPRDRKKFASITKGGKRSVTHYRVIKTHPLGFSLLHLKLETGRTHQIRVHLSEMGHPILGDRVYGKKSDNNKKLPKTLLEKLEKLHRFALHAAELSFAHPSTGRELHFHTTWPENLIAVIQELNFHNTMETSWRY